MSSAQNSSVDVQFGAPPTVIDPKLLRRTLGAFATGVTVVTVGGATPRGMTANSFTSVSLDPPLVLVCVERDAIMHGALAQNGVFGISVLAAHQEAIARHFADRRRPLGSEQFRPVDSTPGQLTGAPLIVDAVVHLECEVWRMYDGGDHTIFLANVLSLSRLSGDEVLVFLHGKFHRLDRERNDTTG